MDFSLKSGNKLPLAKVPLAEASAKAHLGAETVIFSMKQGAVIKNIFFKSGEIVFANSNSKSDSLKQLLMNDNKLAENQISVINDHIAKNKSTFLDTIIALGYFPKDKVDDLKLKQVNHIVTGCSSLNDGMLEVVKNDAIFSKIQHFTTNLHQLIIEGVIKYLPDDFVKNNHPDISEENYLIILEKGHDDVILGRIPPEAKGLLTIVQSSPKIGDVFSNSFLKEEHIYKYIYCLKIFGLLATESAQSRESRLLDKSLSDEEKALKEQIIQVYESYKNKTYYQILDVLEDAPKKELDEALQSKKEQYNPAKFRKLFWADQKDLPDRIIMKLDEAYSILVDENKRAEYDIFVAKGEAHKFMEKSTTIGKDSNLSAAREAIAKNDLKNAIDHYNAALKHAPGSADILCETADAIYKVSGGKNTDLLNKALSYLKEAHKSDPENFLIFIEFGRIFKDMGKNDNAIESFKKALLLNPNSEEAQKGLAGLDPKMADRIKIQGLYKSLEDLNYYQILNIPNEASSDAIKKAYHKTTKTYHPDRHFSEENKDLKDMTKAIYKRVVEAYMVLKNPTKRKEYDDQLGEYKPKKDIRLKDASDVVQKKEKVEVKFKSSQARKFYELGMTSFNLNKLNAAKINFQLALQAEPDNIVIKRKLKEVIDKEKEIDD